MTPTVEPLCRMTRQQKSGIKRVTNPVDDRCWRTRDKSNGRLATSRRTQGRCAKAHIPVSRRNISTFFVACGTCVGGAVKKRAKLHERWCLSRASSTTKVRTSNEPSGGYLAERHYERHTVDDRCSESDYFLRVPVHRNPVVF